MNQISLSSASGVFSFACEFCAFAYDIICIRLVSADLLGGELLYHFEYIIALVSAPCMCLVSYPAHSASRHFILSLGRIKWQPAEGARYETSMCSGKPCMCTIWIIVIPDLIYYHEFESFQQLQSLKCLLFLSCSVLPVLSELYQCELITGGDVEEMKKLREDLVARIVLIQFCKETVTVDQTVTVMKKHDVDEPIWKLLKGKFICVEMWIVGNPKQIL